MKNAFRILTSSICLLGLQAFAGTGSIDTSKTVATPTDSNASFEFDTQEMHAFGGDLQRGDSLHVRDIDENYAMAHLVFTPRVKFGILRFGATYERFDFDLPDRTFTDNPFLPLAGTFQFPGTQLADRLQAAYIVVGIDSEFSDSLLFRVEARPGWYGAGSNLFDGDNFALQGIAGVTYIYSPSLQFTLGVGITPNGHYPVLPGGGVRWKIAPQWTLDAVIPTPRLDYEVTRSFTVWGGADIKSNTYRVNDDFGDSRFDQRLNHAYLSYSEVRTGVGFDWKLTHAITFTTEGGYIPYRDFDFFRSHVRYQQDGGAPYAGASFHAAF